MVSSFGTEGAMGYHSELDLCNFSVRDIYVPKYPMHAIKGKRNSRGMFQLLSKQW